MDIVSEVKPNQATLVPDSPNANTSDHGWDIKANREKLIPIIEKLKSIGIRVSLFMDPDASNIAMAKEIGADRVELYTEPYARAFRTNENVDEIVQKYATSARAAQDAGLGVNAGHDLNLNNLGKFLTKVSEILEVSIGHALIAEALEMGLHKTVKEYLKILAEN
jgi:pyridoxine 5-phosphate synthase